MLVYKFIRNFFILIIIALIIFTIGYFVFAKPLNDKYKELGYKAGETAFIDPMTGNIIPKNELETYDNGRIELITEDGETVYLGEIKLILEEMKKLIGGSGEIKDKEKLKGECDILLTKYLSVEYEIRDDELFIDGNWISGDIDLESKINELVRKHLENQNNK